MRAPHPAHLVVDLTGLHRAAAGAIDADHDTLGPGILECSLQTLNLPL